MLRLGRTPRASHACRLGAPPPMGLRLVKHAVTRRLHPWRPPLTSTPLQPTPLQPRRRNPWRGRKAAAPSFQLAAPRIPGRRSPTERVRERGGSPYRWRRPDHPSPPGPGRRRMPPPLQGGLWSARASRSHQPRSMRAPVPPRQAWRSRAPPAPRWELPSSVPPAPQEMEPSQALLPPSATESLQLPALQRRTSRSLPTPRWERRHQRSPTIGPGMRFRGRSLASRLQLPGRSGAAEAARRLRPVRRRSRDWW